MNTQIDPKLPEELRPLLHDKIDHLDATSL